MSTIENTGPLGADPEATIRAMDEMMPRMEQPQEPEEGVIRLDELTLLKIENLSMQVKIAQLEEQNLIMEIQNIRKRTVELRVEDARLIEEIRVKFGLPSGKSIKLIDRAKGLCAVVE